MNKFIREAIGQGHPMHWEMIPGSSFHLRLVATTYTYENGRARTRTLWTTYDARHAHYVHGVIIGMQGGKLSGPTPRQMYEQWEEEHD